MTRSIRLPLNEREARALRAGDSVLLSGVLYTGRDAAHKRLCRLLAEGKPLPFDLRDATIYYVGPTPARPGAVIGSAGPTTSYRMDSYAPLLLAHGLRGMIGKGYRSPEVIAAMQAHGAVYFGAVGGAAALIAGHIEASEVIAFDDLGTEAIRKLTVRDFPAFVVIDSLGNNLYETGPAQWRAP